MLAGWPAEKNKTNVKIKVPFWSLDFDFGFPKSLSITSPVSLTVTPGLRFGG